MVLSKKIKFFILSLIILTILMLFIYTMGLSKKSSQKCLIEAYKYKKLTYSFITYDGLVFLKRNNSFKPIPSESKVAAILVKDGKIIIDFLNFTEEYLYVNFTVMFKYFESKKLFSSSAILKIDTKTCYVYDVKDNFIGKWIYTLSSDVPVEELELKKHIRNCTLVLANYHGKEFYGPCLKVLKEDKEMILIGPNIEKRIVLDESRNIVLDGVPHCYYNPKSKLLVRVEDAILDDILYNVFGIYYIDNAYLILIKAEKA